MIDIKNIYKQTFRAIKNDTKLLDLLGVKYKDVDENTFLTNLRKQVTETSSPERLLEDYSTRICVHERDGGYRGIYEEVGFLTIDVHVSKDRNTRTGELSDVVKRVIEILDTRQREKQGLKKLNIGLYGLKYNTRVYSEKHNNTGWEKYSIIFEYRYIL